MKNNKITRKKHKKEFTTQSDGTEVLKSKESKQKQRRWTYEADVTLVMAAHTNPEGVGVPARVLPQRTLKLEAISYGTAKDARQDCINHEQYLRTSNKMFEDSLIHVRALPKETVSNETIRQIQGYRDMSFILDKALELACLSDGYKSIPAEHNSIKEVKEMFYKRALELLKPQQEVVNGVQQDNNQSGQQQDEALQQASESSDNGQNSSDDSSIIVPPFEREEERIFVPEIVTVERAASE